MRITRHAVAADDRTPFHEAMCPTLRAAGSYDERFRASGLAVADADALVPHLLDFAHRPRARIAIEAMLGERLGAPPEPGLWRAVRAIASLVHAPTERPCGFARMASYVAPPAAGTPHAGGDAALRTLVLRYLAAFGQASRQDFAQVATLRRVEVRPAFETLADALVVLEGPDGATLCVVPGAPLPGENALAPLRLLAMWDSVLLAYADGRSLDARVGGGAGTGRTAGRGGARPVNRGGYTPTRSSTRAEPAGYFAWRPRR